MSELMTIEQFRDQHRCASEMPDAEAASRQESREALGQIAVIYLFPSPVGSEPRSFWTDIHGKARIDDGVAPLFREMNGKTVRGIALWRTPAESCYTE